MAPTGAIGEGAGARWLSREATVNMSYYGSEPQQPPPNYGYPPPQQQQQVSPYGYGYNNQQPYPTSKPNYDYPPPQQQQQPPQQQVCLVQALLKHFFNRFFILHVCVSSLVFAVLNFVLVCLLLLETLAQLIANAVHLPPAKFH